MWGSYSMGIHKRFLRAQLTAWFEWDGERGGTTGSRLNMTFGRAIGFPIARTSLDPLNFANVSIEQIKEAIEQLSIEERAELAGWLHG